MNRRERRAQWQASQRAALGPAPAAARSLVSGGPARPRAVPVAALSAVSLQIGELVLRGFEKRHGSRIAAAFERSLAERLRAGALPNALRHPMKGSSLRLSPLTLRRVSDPVAMGEQLAASVVAFERDARRRGGSR